MQESLTKKCRVSGKTDVGEFYAELSPVAGEECGRSSPPCRGKSRICDELTRTPFPVPPCCWQKRIQE